jgi:hypothetical protein
MPDILPDIVVSPGFFESIEPDIWAKADDDIVASKATIVKHLATVFIVG